MLNRSDQFEIRQIAESPPDCQEALHRVLGLTPPPSGGPPEWQALAVLAHAQRTPDWTDFFVGAYRGDRLVNACLAVVSPGAAATVYVSGRLTRPIEFRATVAALQVIRTTAWRRSVSLLEVLIPPQQEALGRALAAAGFRYLTRLVYFRRDVGAIDRLAKVATDLDWVAYSRESEPLFAEALDRSYVQSMDCPELTEVRSTEDVLASHRATGIFDPGLWWVAMRRGEPVGVILLCRIHRERALELVYMGVARPARGAGVGDALLRRGFELADRAGVRQIALAIDRRNEPARRMYARWGFVEAGERDAWIATLRRT